MNEYALCVELETNPNTYEVFDMYAFPDDKLLSWKTNFSEKTAMMISLVGFPKISIGSILDNNNFILNYDREILELPLEKKVSYALINNNTIFSLIHLNENSYEAQKYSAAIDSGKIIGIDVTDQNVELGDIWNGISFFKPGEKNV